MNKVVDLIENRIAQLRTYKLARNTYVPAIIRELELLRDQIEEEDSKIEERVEIGDEYCDRIGLWGSP